MLISIFNSKEHIIYVHIKGNLKRWILLQDC